MAGTSIVSGLELQSLTKNFGPARAVRGINLSVAQGEFLTVLGPSGSGKTTVLRMIAGFTDITGGLILLSGRDVSRMTPAERNIGMVFQNYALFPHMSAGDNIAYGLKMRGWGKAERVRRVDEMLELVGLAGMGARLPRELSGGQQQRVALARALAFRPELLLMDEPLGALDRELRIRMAGELRRIHAETKTTVVYVTHDREEALTLSDRIAVMLDGRVEAIDTPERLYRQPSSSFVATFFGGHNLVAGKAVRPLGDGMIRVHIPVFDKEVDILAGTHVSGEIAVAVPAQAFRFAQDVKPNEMRVTLQAHESVYMGDVTRIVGIAHGPGTNSDFQIEVPGHHLDAASAGRNLDMALDLTRCVAVPITERVKGSHTAEAA
ncbi:ABC transporter ATP-binding protein [Bosea sp. (in: a-proteobacteria)]|uniref:ABC transporter ATP-binding protein n=1 Tax=Bosea sp. (in: a-proteobacteria) TaxID=1871050 RepID=UPI002624F6C3|nr:ABC transporter ATP-binding protein [Bosea sp. (in: a-proteobacteria)]MCO5092178.1 ABC transporter ATP-binding protein [Bosea sp. (in: a-proteobacteria)]